METKLVVEATIKDRPTVQEDEQLLAAALAALLVEVGRTTDGREILEGAGDQTSWRMMGRWEQLQG